MRLPPLARRWLRAVPLLGLGLATPAWADVPGERHGAVSGPVGATVEGGVTTTFQHADDRRAGDEAAASLDLVATMPAGPGVFTLYVEGNTTPGREGLTALLPEANGDVGSALDGDGRGRLQVSELRYEMPLGTWSLSAGLLDPAGFMDASEVANDETSQFLNTTLVNNPTIGAPDYSLGAALHLDATPERPGLTLLLAGSHGLADNPDHSYSELVDLSADGKGLFAALETYYQTGTLTARLGLWTSTADHDRLDGEGTGGNLGVYGVLDGAVGATAWNLRAGWADPEVSEAAAFLSGAVEYPLAPAATLGAGLSHTWASPDSDLDDSTQAEVYVRFALGENVHISPDLQWVRNPGLDGTGEAVGQQVWIAGLRLGVTF